MKLTMNEYIESSFCFEKSSSDRNCIMPLVTGAFVALFIEILSCITQCDVCDVMCLRFQLAAAPSVRDTQSVIFTSSICVGIS